jgi:NAD(P)-dependent dehydrogenase (short-subunit alcohol dehydrogenase family)
VTGGDSAIGRAAAIAYAKEGADVAINYLPSEIVELFISNITRN